MTIAADPIGLYGFDDYHDDDPVLQRAYCTAALLVYAVWRSRDRARFTITPDVWERVTRFVRASAKRANRIPVFLEKLMPRLACGALRPAALDIGVTAAKFYTTNPDTGEIMAYGGDAAARTHLADILRDTDERFVLRLLRDDTQYLIDLVRARLERERVVEAAIIATVEGEIV